MQKLTFFFFALLFPFSLTAQSKVEIETSKPLCLFSFLETASFSRSVSTSFYEYIMDELEKDKTFMSIAQNYSTLKLEYSYLKEEYPERRHSSRSTKDLLWIAAANAKDIDDFSERIIGILPNTTHAQLIEAMTKIEPYYDELIWEKEQENIARVEQQLAAYISQIEQLFLKAKQFYNSSWDNRIPFKISLYPIPLENGGTVAIPKGNVLICSFLSHREVDKGLVGIAVHEMCHLLYDEQSAKFQNELNHYFSTSESAYKKLAYAYLNEGLATAIGNGWAYQQIYGELDTAAWYNDVYINGFAHALLPTVNTYMQQDRAMDSTFVQTAISSFEQKFPKAIYETAILMNDTRVFANTENEQEIDRMMDALMSNYRITSMWFNTPINDAGSRDNFRMPDVTKLFIIESDHRASLKILADYFEQPKLNNLPLNSFHSFEDAESESPVLLFVVENMKKLTDGITALKKRPYLDFGQGFEF